MTTTIEGNVMEAMKFTCPKCGATHKSLYNSFMHIKTCKGTN
jgi:hypothetical protein